MELKYYLQDPIIIVMSLIFLSGVISAIIGTYKRQPILPSFLLGIMAGPIGWLIVFFNKGSESIKEDKIRIDALLSQNTRKLDKKEFELTIKSLEQYINTAERGRIVFLISSCFSVSSMALWYIFTSGHEFIGNPHTFKLRSIFWVIYSVPVVALYFIRNKSKNFLKNIITCSLYASIMIAVILCAHTVMPGLIKSLTAALMLASLLTALISYLFTFLSAHHLYYLITQKKAAEPDLNDLTKGEEMDWVNFIFINKVIKPAKELLRKLKDRESFFVSN